MKENKSLQKINKSTYRNYILHLPVISRSWHTVLPSTNVSYFLVLLKPFIIMNRARTLTYNYLYKSHFITFIGNIIVKSTDIWTIKHHKILIISHQGGTHFNFHFVNQHTQVDYWISKRSMSPTSSTFKCTSQHLEQYTTE